MTPVVKFCRLHPARDADLPLPRYMTGQAAGMDLCAAVTEPMTLAKGAIELIPTGLAVALPRGFEAQVRPRSGLAVRHGITLINSPGTIDADYRGEIMIGLINHGPKAYTIQRGDRVAQMIISPAIQLQIEMAEKLDDTARQNGGFGHTGR